MLFLALKCGRVSLVGDEGFDMVSFNDFVQFGTLIHMDSNFLAIIVFDPVELAIDLLE